ncbi:hypothetical protein ES703_52281 [subsurface metagenome]
MKNIHLTFHDAVPGNHNVRVRAAIISSGRIIPAVNNRYHLAVVSLRSPHKIRVDHISNGRYDKHIRFILSKIAVIHPARKQKSFGCQDGFSNKRYSAPYSCNHANSLKKYTPFQTSRSLSLSGQASADKNKKDT